MIDIIALIFLCKKNGDLALQKGLKPGTWKLYTVLAWVFAEFIGVAVALLIWGWGNMFAVMSVGLICAFGGYLVIRAVLERKVDNFDDEVNRIGVDDLSPRK